MELVSADRGSQVRRGLRLEYVTIGYNVIEAAVSIGAGTVAGSLALIGFGLDSVIEVTSGVVLVWRLANDHRAAREASERTALRIVGWCFLALAAYVGIDSARSLWGREAPDESVWGIGIAAASLVIMPLLARAKRQVAAGIGSASLHADAKQTELCTYLSAILLGGLALNAAFGWWWADPLAALAMTPIIAREGIAALQGKQCGCAGHCAT